MGVEVVKSELMPASKEENSGLLHGKENGKSVLSEPIKFGSNGTDERVKQEVNNVSEVNFPKDVVDEWPERKEIHSFYIVKYRSYDDQKLKAKLDQADKERQRKNKSRSQITEKLRAKRADRAQLIAQLKSLTIENRQFRTIMDEKRKDMEPLQQALGKLRGGSSMARERGVSICSSEDELNVLIKSLQYRIQHESIPLVEEKQLLREIKQFEGTREKVIANAAERAKIEDSLGEKEAIQDQVKLIGVDLDGVRKEQQVVRAKLKQLEDEKEAIDKEINALQEELTTVTENRDKTFENIQGLRKQRDEGNACFYQNRMLLTKARELAARKDVEGLRKLSDVEVENFMAQWNCKKAFRDDYERRILSSLDIRQFSRDGRMRNPDEKPLVEAPAPAEADFVAKNIVELPKEDSTPQNDISFSKKVHKEKNSKQLRETGNEATEETLEQRDFEDKEEIYGLEKKQEKVSQIDEAKLKELKREEELAKAKQALERKKKLAEKAAAKAAIKAQKEAEKKLREREKKAKKKAAVVTDGVEPNEAVAEANEPEEADENVDEESVPPKYKETPKGKEQKEYPVRYRSRKGPDTRPKAKLKRKNTTNYWVWVAPAAAILLLILVLYFNYFQTSSVKV